MKKNCMLHTWVKCWSTHRATLTHPNETAYPKGLLSVLHTWRLLISGCSLTPFNRIRLVLGFLCSVEDAHAISQGKEEEKSRSDGGRMQSGAMAAVAVAYELGLPSMRLPVRWALISQLIFSLGKR